MTPRDATIERGGQYGYWPSFRIETHGCKLNMADSQKLAGEFLSVGFCAAGSDDDPSVFVLNSCTVTSTADKKARQAISSARRRFPSAFIVAAGCYTERDRSAFDGAGLVDLVAGNREKDGLAVLVAGIMGVTSPPGGTGAAAGREVLRSVGRSRASVKIQEGCDQVCAYCIVPKVRGRERSIPPELVIGQVDSLARDGCGEVVLTGTQLGSYGFDLPGADLPKLLRSILAETCIPRLRVSSLQPLEVTDETLEVWAAHGTDRLCPHFHMPLQSGSEKVLRRMRRRYTPEEYALAVGRVRDAVPTASITTDVICGFPGESESDHAETVALMGELEFADAHVFPYSERPGTSASHFHGRIDASTKSRRAAAVRQVASAMAASYRRRSVGQLRTALWEGDRGLSGLTEDYLRVRFAGRPRSDGSEGADSFERVRIAGVDGKAVLAEPT